MTRSNLQPYSITNLVGGSNHQAAPQLTQNGKSKPKQSVAEQWIALAGSGSTSNKFVSRPFVARGVYTYDASTTPKPGFPRTDRVDFKLRVSGNRLHGTSKDSVGSATVDGQIDLQKDTIRFIKQYNAPNEKFRWEYEGHFTSCGIVGEWHYPGDPPTKKFQRGRFAIWLQSDEALKEAILRSNFYCWRTRGLFSQDRCPSRAAKRRRGIEVQHRDPWRCTR